MSSPIDIPDGPSLPNIGYYSTTNDGSGYTGITALSNSYSTLQKNLIATCVNSTNSEPLNNENGIYTTTDLNVKNYLPNNDVSSLDIPFYLAKVGKLVNKNYNNSVTSKSQPTKSLDGKICYTENTTTPPPTDPMPLNNKIIELCNNDDGGPQQITNQIQYLTCQVEQLRNQKYDPNSLKTNDIENFFYAYPHLKIPFMIIFIITIYLLVNGFFSSLDLGANIFKEIISSMNSTASYYIGLLSGLAIPIISLCLVYNHIICNNLAELEKYDITNDPYGIKNLIDKKEKQFDIGVLVIFILLIYVLVGLLFTLDYKKLSPYLYLGLVSVILFIISVFMYILYAYIPFFNSADKNNIVDSSLKKIKFFIDQQTSISPINNNQTEDILLKKCFLYTFICIVFLCIMFLVLKYKLKNFIILNNLINGFLSSFAILALPAIWVFNFIFAMKYFVSYPFFILVLRFLRYILIAIIYIFTTKYPSLKLNFSTELHEKLDNFKNYTPTWGLFGADELKLILSMMGYENIFSKQIISNNQNSNNLSNNLFISTGSFGYLFNYFATGEKYMTGIIYGAFIILLTIIISMFFLFGVFKLNKAS